MIVQEQEHSVEQDSAEGTGSRKANLLESLMKASAKPDNGEDNERDSKHRLSIDDVRGNLYIFNFAGHEMTANALCFAIDLLAAYPQWQDWILAEVDAVGGDVSNYERHVPQDEEVHRPDGEIILPPPSSRL